MLEKHGHHVVVASDGREAVALFDTLERVRMPYVVPEDLYELCRAVVEHPVWIEKVITLASEQNGIFYPLAVPMAYVAKGMKVGYVTNYFGEKTADILAPVVPRKEETESSSDATDLPSASSDWSASAVR